MAGRFLQCNPPDAKRAATDTKSRAFCFKIAAQAAATMREKCFT
jgi:hypothetical protein